MELVIFLTATVVESEEHPLVAADEELRDSREHRQALAAELTETAGSQMSADLRALTDLEKLRESERKLGSGGEHLNETERARRWKAEEELREELIIRLQKQRTQRSGENSED